MVDPYVLPNGTLRNKRGILDAAELLDLEARTVPARQALLMREGHDGPFDIAFYMHIHKRLFGGIYEWAGMPRTIPLAKAQEVGKPDVTHFTSPKFILPRLKSAIAQIPPTQELAVMELPQAVGKLASAFGSINTVHPFREGNGRTQRLYLKMVANAAGFDLHWEVMTQERMVAASVANSRGDAKVIARMFADVADPERVLALSKVTRFLQANQPDWNNRYIATTVEGQRYDGVFGGRSDDDVMVRVNTDSGSWFASAKTEDLENSDLQPGDPVSFTAKQWKPF